MQRNDTLNYWYLVTAHRSKCCKVAYLAYQWINKKQILIHNFIRSMYSILCQYSCIPTPHPLTSQQTWFFEWEYPILWRNTISLASIKLESRLLIPRNHSMVTRPCFLGRGWGLDTKHVAETGMAWSWSTTDVISGWIDRHSMIPLCSNCWSRWQSQ